MMLNETDPGHKRDGHRSQCAADILARLEPRKAEFGITRLANVTGLDRVGIPVVLATRPNSRSVAVSQGKGPTVAAAKAAALMEAIELWHAENIDRRMFFASHDEISNRHTTVSISELPQVAGSRYSGDLRMHWIDGHDLMTGRAVLIPYELVHADYTHPVPPGHGCFASSTNGLASGGHPLEAICYGICEVIERDAITVWHHRRPEARASSRVDPSSIDAAAGRELLALLEAAGLEVALWDATSDVGAATFQCLIVDRNESDGHIGLGSGTHPDRGQALVRSLAEAAQTRLNYITGARDDLAMEEFLPHGRLAKARAARALLALGPPVRDFTAVPSKVTPSLRADLDWLLERLAGGGVSQVAVVDLSRSAPDVWVVRVVVPGLEAPHDDDGYVPGRRAIAAREMP